jgi:ribosomal protein L11 methyltransferase
MPWLEVSLRVSRDAVPAAEGALESLGALSVTLQDDADVPVLEPGPGSTPLWPVVQVRGLFEQAVDRAAIVDGLQQLPGVERPERVQWREVGDQDWERAWMDRFEPMRFGRRLWVVPSGMAIPPAPDNVEIRLDPGLAFGTGTHPTTALCLAWLDGQEMAGRRVLDYGCGSGILGIAAALLGAVRVDCVDNDPQALESTAANADRNSVGSRIHCWSPESFSAGPVDAVLANILAGPLVELAPLLTDCVGPGGRIVLSGLLEEQAQRVAAAYRPACEVTSSAALDGWARLDLRRTR